MKIAAILVVALAIATTAYGAPKQIVIAPPPPPAAQSGIGPGLIFGFVIKGYTNSTFGATQINQLCPALINFTVGYPRTALKCYLGPEGVNPYPGNYVIVTGFLQWQNFPGMTDQDKANAVISRDANEYFLQNNAVGSLNTTFPGIMVDCSCNPYYNNFLGIRVQRDIPGVPYATCYTEPKFEDADTIGTVGIDNGKVCPTGPQYIVPAVLQEVNLAGSGAGIACEGVGDNKISECAIYFDDANAVLNQVMPGQNFNLYFSPGGEIDGCTQDEQEIILEQLSNQLHTVRRVSTIAEQVILFSMEATCSGQLFTYDLDFPNAELRISGAWSALCDSDFAFYKANNPIQEFPEASMPSIGYTCPACSSSSGNNAVLFNYNGPNKGKYCSAFPLANGVNGEALNFPETAISGTSCVRIVVDTGSLAGNGGKPMLYGDLPTGVPMSAVFPGISPQTIVEYDSEFAGPVAIDTQMNVPCSNPPLFKSPTPGAVAGVLDRGTCNTMSAFDNGGTKGLLGVPDNGIPNDADSCAILTTVINGPLAPGPSPPVVPSPAVSPKPVVPSPAAGPSPILPPLKCTYSGVYRIRPYYAPCGGKYIAWASPSNCSNTIVNLRSKNELGGKLQRAAWALKTSATGKVGVPTPILAPKECSAKHLAAPSNPSNGLKLGGDSWKWQVVPAEGTKDCDMVNLISENRLKTTAHLSVPKINSKQCSGKFAWAAKDGGRQRFRITKV